MKGFIVFCLMLLILVPVPAFAGDEPIVLEEVVVTATRVERPIGTISSSVTVIDREEIEKSYAKTVGDLLRREVGVQVRQPRGLTGLRTGINMRGTGERGTGVLILKDGIPLTNKYLGRGTMLLNSMSVQDIERIEIVRGAASALYGSSAMGGVINIITRQAKPGFSGNVSLEGGNMDTAIGSLGLRYGAENFALRFAAEHKETGGYEYRDPWDPLWQLPEMTLNHISLGGDLLLGDSLLRVDFDNFQEDALVGRGTQQDITLETNKFRVSWKTPLRGFGEETVFNIKGYYFDDESNTISHRHNPATGKFDNFRSSSKHSGSDYGIMSQISTVLGNHRLVAGIDLSGANVDHHARTVGGGRGGGGGDRGGRGGDRGSGGIVVVEDRKFESTQSLWAVFVHNEMSLGERVILSAGLRYDHWENKDGRFFDHADGEWKEFPTVTDSAISPRGGIVYKLTEDTRLRASFGTGFRAPSLSDMYRSGPDGRRHYDLRNLELKSEKLDWSYDIGVDIQHHDNFTLSLTFYQSRLSDFLERNILQLGDQRIPVGTDSDGLDVRQMLNIGEVDIHGLEASLEFRLNEKWSAFVNHTYNVSKVRKHEQGPVIEGNYLPWSPRHTSVVGFTYDNPQLFTLSLSIENRSSRFARLDNVQEVPGFQMVNMRVSRELFEGLDIFANVENLTDESWMGGSETIGIPFNFLVGTRYTF